MHEQEMVMQMHGVLGLYLIVMQAREQARERHTWDGDVGMLSVVAGEAAEARGEGMSYSCDWAAPVFPPCGCCCCGMRDIEARATALGDPML